MIVLLLRSVSGGLEKTGSLEIIPENCPLDPAGRLSISLDDQNLSSSGPSSCGSPPHAGGGILGLGGGSQTLPGRLTASASSASAPGRRHGQQGQQQPEMMSYTCLPQVRQPSQTLIAAIGLRCMQCKPKPGGRDTDDKGLPFIKNAQISSFFDPPPLLWKLMQT